MNISEIEAPLIVAKTCVCREKNRLTVTYQFVDSCPSLCLDKKNLILGQDSHDMGIKLEYKIHPLSYPSTAGFMRNTKLRIVPLQTILLTLSLTAFSNIKTSPDHFPLQLSYLPYS
jgi:hypothetical protein